MRARSRRSRSAIANIPIMGLSVSSTPFGERIQYDFDVGMTVEFISSRRQLGGDRLMAVNLAVMTTNRPSAEIIG
jgi:hypothetical protein